MTTLYTRYRTASRRAGHALGWLLAMVPFAILLALALWGEWLAELP